MDGRDGEQIQSVHDMIGRFTTELLGKLEPWRDVLRDNPADLETIETSVHQAFARGADMLVAGLIATTMAEQPFQDAAEQTRQQFSRPLQKG